MKLFTSFIIISSVLKDISKGISYFNNADFFAAHDIFEELWVESSREDRRFFQGLVQISVGCFHLASSNYRGALNQLTKGIQKLNEYLPSYYNIDLTDLSNKIDLLILGLNKYFTDNNYVIDIGRIPKIKVK